MRAKIVFAWSLLTAIMSLSPARAQQYSAPAPGGDAPPRVKVKLGEPGQSEDALNAPGLSSWITYHKDNGCDGPTGNGCHIMTELFLRSGFAVPTDTTSFGRTLGLGWDIDGGGRLLL